MKRNTVLPHGGNVIQEISSAAFSLNRSFADLQLLKVCCFKDPFMRSLVNKAVSFNKNHLVFQEQVPNIRCPYRLTGI